MKRCLVMKKLFSLFVLLTFFSGLARGQSIKEEGLAQKYKEWLNLTRYIILSEEREVFQKLTNDREKDIFIEAFWKQRDPTPGTPQNEYKEEIIKRFIYATNQFGRGATREGWMTDMGKIYILLGPPASRESYFEVRGIYPCEAWYYYGDTSKGLPAYFGLLFYKKGGVGEFKLYHQVADGPGSLLVGGQNIDMTDYPALYQKIKGLAPTLAPLTLSLDPSDIPYNFQPSLRTDNILADIFNSPRKEVNPSYATHFLNYRGIVSTEYLTNYVEIDGLAEALPDPLLGLNFIHFSLAPKTISVDYYQPKDQYFCNYSIDISLREGEKVICQYAKEFPVYFSPEDDLVVRTNGISLQDSFPVIEGKHKLVILVRNSVAKEFSVYEKDIKVEKTTSPKIIGPLLGYKLEAGAVNFHAPFQMLDKKLTVDPKQTFTRDDEIAVSFNLTEVSQELWQQGEVRIHIQGLEGTDLQEKLFSLKLNAYPFNAVMTIVHAFSAGELAPDYYEITLSLVGGNGSLLDEKKANFIISPAKVLPRPVVISKSFPLANAYLYFYMIADQYDKAGELENAAAMFERSFALAPEYREGIVYYSNFQVKTKKYSQALDLVENLKVDEKFRFDYYLIKGRAHMGLGQYKEAIESLLEGNKIYDSDTTLLNALGYCFYRTGQKKQALEALDASLRLNPDQAEVKNLIQEIRER